MKTKTKKNKVIVKYWQGTTKMEGTATTYRGAMRIASRNQNKYPPTFWTPEGEELFDINGMGLATEADAQKSTITLYM